MLYNSETVKIFDKLTEIKDTLVGDTRFTLGDLSILIEGKDGIGGLIEEWFGEWAKLNNFNIKNPKKENGASQEFPDYYVWDNTNVEHLLEVKTFDANASANFDIANFQSYCQSLGEFPERVNADYLIFAYQVNEGKLSIKEIFLKKIWEITGPSERWPLKTQTKRDVIYNIRPSAFYSKHARFPTFSSKDEFIEALFKTEELYLNRPSVNRENYLKNI